MIKPLDISPQERPFLDAVVVRALTSTELSQAMGLPPRKIRVCGTLFPGDARTVCTREPGHKGAHRARIPNHKSRRNWKIKGWPRN